MFYISDIQTTAPDRFLSQLQEKTYEMLKLLQIPFQRVETDEIVTMEDCVQVNQKLRMKMVKTLFLCNRQRTEFYLFVTCGGKPFKSKEFAAALGISRVSFAPIELMEGMLGTKIGAATVFSVLLDAARKVRVVLDGDVVDEEWYGCGDGTNTGYMKIKTSQIVQDFLSYAKHSPTVIRV
ncbi:MAG: prolyl-tRNA synthetase associated domain-containing protein [Synergistaceae bacterium]|nr:prolyl-tRNA synthetase associated domain-containing protein [Synergistaceae bacterium]